VELEYYASFARFRVVAICFSTLMRGAGIWHELRSLAWTEDKRQSLMFDEVARHYHQLPFVTIG